MVNWLKISYLYGEKWLFCVPKRVFFSAKYYTSLVLGHFSDYKEQNGVLCRLCANAIAINGVIWRLYANSIDKNGVIWRLCANAIAKKDMIWRICANAIAINGIKKFPSVQRIEPKGIIIR